MPIIGIVTGAASGLLVVDVDPRNGGNEQLNEFELSNGMLPTGYVVATSDGGDTSTLDCQRM
jgi:hypothetical protein